MIKLDEKMQKMDQISELERRMIAHLQRDASLSMADLAEAVGASTATCWRRLRSLEDRGILSSPRRIVAPAGVGRVMDAFVQVRMTSQDAVSRAKFQRAMEAEPTIVEVYAISGDWDYLLHLLVRDMADLDDILMRHVLEQTSVAGTSTIFALRRVKHTTEVPL